MMSVESMRLGRIGAASTVVIARRAAAPSPIVAMILFIEGLIAGCGGDYWPPDEGGWAGPAAAAAGCQYRETEPLRVTLFPFGPVVARE